MRSEQFDVLLHFDWKKLCVEAVAEEFEVLKA
jgi:hypothetical protein